MGLSLTLECTCRIVFTKLQSMQTHNSISSMQTYNSISHDVKLNLNNEQTNRTTQSAQTDELIQLHKETNIIILQGTIVDKTRVMEVARLACQAIV